MRYFVGICDAGSITRAAKVLHVAQPSLSSHISKLEARLKVELLHRTPVGVVPTESGEILYASAQRVLREIDRVSAEVSALKDDPAGAVAIGVAAAPSNVIGKSLVRKMVQRYPNITLLYSEGLSADLYRKLRTGRLDIGIFYKEPEVEGISSETLMREELFVVTPRPRGAPRCDDPLTIAELRKLRFVFPRPSPFSIRRIVEYASADFGFASQTIAEIDSFTTIKQLVVEGFACTVLPWSGVYEEVAEGTIALRRVEGMPIRRDIELCLPVDQPQTISISVVRTMVIDLVRDLINSGEWPHASLSEAIA